MSSEDIPYFKIKYAFLPMWTLEQAAFLLLGHNPMDSEFKIEKHENNEVNNLYRFLCTKAKQEELHFIEQERVPKGKGFLASKITYYYSVDQFFECMEKEKYKYDKEIFGLRKLLTYKMPEKDKKGREKNHTHIRARLNKALYRRAAEVIRQKYPAIKNPTLADSLVFLPSRLNNKYPINLTSEHSSTIQGYLKGYNQKPGRTKNSEKSIDNFSDWDYLIENM